MKKVFVFVGALALCSSVVFTACKKKKSEDPAVDTELIEVSDQSSDESSARNDSDEIIDDAVKALARNAGGRMEAFSGCGVTLDTASVILGTIKLNYDGESCDGSRTRKGSISINYVPTAKFVNKGSSFSIKFDNFTVTRKASSKTLILNGTKIITNKTGGYATWALAGKIDSTVTHTVKGNLKLTFPDGNSRNWTFNRKRSFSKDKIVIAADSTTGIIAFGETRKGAVFTTKLITPITITMCGKSPKITAGVVNHTVIPYILPITTTFGLVSSGAAASTPCEATHFKVSWFRGAMADSKLIEMQ